ncbi:MAG: hypothetical protein JSW73_05105 [Candidatus Woesearchaeota archaeon]|nr:MAG: hypothetical protein JSW73_05105 [Candidatus Woesearchaeota archaeon]
MAKKETLETKVEKLSKLTWIPFIGIPVGIKEGYKGKLTENKPLEFYGSAIYHGILVGSIPEFIEYINHII